MELFFLYVNCMQYFCVYVYVYQFCDIPYMLFVNKLLLLLICNIIYYMIAYISKCICFYSCCHILCMLYVVQFMLQVFKDLYKSVCCLQPCFTDLDLSPKTIVLLGLMFIVPFIWFGTTPIIECSRIHWTKRETNGVQIYLLEECVCVTCLRSQCLFSFDGVLCGTLFSESQ